jgi:hypothetical protein
LEKLTVLAVTTAPDDTTVRAAYQAVTADSIAQVEVIPPLLFDHLAHKEDWVIPIILAANL